MAQLDLAFVGTSTVVNARDYLNYDFTPRPDASRFEFSTPNFNDWVYFLEALTLLNEIGFSAVRERILYLAAYLKDGLRARGFQVRGSDRTEEQSGIVALTRKGFDAEGEAARLGKENIVVAARDGALRASPHIFNNEADLDRLLQAL